MTNEQLLGRRPTAPTGSRTGSGISSRRCSGPFGALTQPDPQFQPDPLGSVFDFPTAPQRCGYWDKLYRHPASGHEQNYLAACICALGHCWIALFDDAVNIADFNVDADMMRAQVEGGRDPESRSSAPRAPRER